MPDEDARLTDFAPASDDGATEGPASDAEGAPDGEQSNGDDEGSPGADPPGDGSADAPPDDGADPAVPTSAWRAEGVCAACGDPAERRWREGGAFVCPDCKEW